MSSTTKSDEVPTQYMVENDEPQIMKPQTNVHGGDRAAQMMGGQHIQVTDEDVSKYQACRKTSFKLRNTQLTVFDTNRTRDFGERQTSTFSRSLSGSTSSRSLINQFLVMELFGDFERIPTLSGTSIPWSARWLLLPSLSGCLFPPGSWSRYHIVSSWLASSLAGEQLRPVWRLAIVTRAF